MEPVAAPVACPPAEPKTADVVDIARGRRPRPAPEKLGASLRITSPTDYAVVVPAAAVTRVRAMLIDQLRPLTPANGFKHVAKIPAVVVVARRGRERFARELDLAVFDLAMREVVDGLALDIVSADPLEAEGAIAHDEGETRVYPLAITRDVVADVVWRGLEFPVTPAAPVTAEDVDACVEGHRRRFTEVCDLAPGEVVAVGDVVELSLKADIEGRENPLVVDNAAVVVGSNRTAILGLEAAVIGRRRGDCFRGRFSWPEVFEPMPVLAGAVGDFDVVVVGAKRRHVPEVDDEFAQTLGAHESVAAMRAAIAEDLAECAEKSAASTSAAAALDVLLEANRERLTPSVEAATRAYTAVLADVDAEARGRGLTRDALLAKAEGGASAWHEKAKARATAIASITRGLRSIAFAEGVVAEEVDIARFFENLARGTIEPPAAYRQRFEAEGRMRAVRDEITRSKAIDLIIAARAVPAQNSPPTSAAAACTPQP